MSKILQWYKQSIKNKIIAFGIIFIFALGYSFLHRPLGLIMWDKFNYVKEYKLMKNNLYEVWQDEEKFLELYHSFYEKQNIDKRSKEIEKELLHYIDKLEIDLFATTFFGLDDLYLLAFAHKTIIYTLNIDWQLADSIINDFHLSKVQTNDYLSFLQSFDKILFFVNRLDNDYLKIQFNDIIIRFMIAFVEITNKENVCDSKINLINMVDSINNTMQGFKNTELEKLLQKDYLEVIEQESSIFKEKLNECQ